MLSLVVFRKKMFRIAGLVHIRIFGYEMGETMVKFLEHLSWSFFGVFIATGIVAIANILAGRWLGPIEYGRYALVVSLSTLFIIPMTLGFDTANTFYLAKSKTSEEKSKYITATISLFGIFTLISGSLLLVFSRYISQVFLIEISLVNIALVFSGVLAFRNILDSIVKGLHLFKFQSLLRMSEAIIVVGAFFLFFHEHALRDYKAYSFAILTGYLFVVIFTLFRVQSRVILDRNVLRNVFSYGKYAVIGSLSTVIFYGTDKILLNKYLGPEQLGIYNAYQTFSFLLVAQLMMFFINVFFPYMVGVSDAHAALKKLNQLGKLLFLPVFFMVITIMRIALIFLGNKYQLDWLLILAFGLLATLSIYFYGLWWLINSRSESGVRFTSFHGIVAGILFLIAMVSFRSFLTVHGVVFLMTLAFSYMILIGNIRFQKIVK